MRLLHLMRATRRALPALAVACAATLPGLSWGQWPDRAITIVVGYPAGSLTDLLARRLGTHLSQRLGQPAVIENRVGGGGIVGAEHTRRAAGDGHTLMVAPPSFVFSPVFRPQTPFHPVNDFTPIAMLSTTTMGLYVHKSVPVSNLQQFVAYSKTQPGGISVGNTGNGSASHVSAELLQMTTGARLTVISYRGGNPAANDLVGGQLPALFYDVGSMQPHFKAGTVKAIGVTGQQRSSIMPDVPTLVEQGAKGFDVDTWFALVGPANIPPAAVQRLNRLTFEAFQTDDAVAWMKDRGLDGSSISAAQVGEFLREEMRRWTEFNKTARISLQE